MKTYRIGVLPGDGIGPEVTTEAVKVMQAVMAGEDDIDLIEYRTARTI
jgi:3-isopropylmalate dehydrogenase